MDNSPRRHTMAQLNLYLYHSSTSERVTVITLWLRYFNYKAVLSSWSGERDWRRVQWIGKLFTKMTQGYIISLYLRSGFKSVNFQSLKKTNSHGSSFPVRLNLMLCTKKQTPTSSISYLPTVYCSFHLWMTKLSFL